MNENLSFQENDEINELELDVYVKNVILEAQASLANIFITVSSTSIATVQEQVNDLGVSGSCINNNNKQTLFALVKDENNWQLTFNNS